MSKNKSGWKQRAALAFFVSLGKWVLHSISKNSLRECMRLAEYGYLKVHKETMQAEWTGKTI